MKIPFYLLGLLIRYGPKHGYSLKQIIEERISDFAKIKLPTIYYHLDKLKDKGYVTETPDKEGNRPEKLVYSITPDGCEYFSELFQKQLKENYYPEFSTDGVLYFREKIDDADLCKVLESKKQDIQRKLKALERHKSNTLSKIHEKGRFSAEAIFDHHIYHLKAELSWLQKTIEGLSE